MRLEVLGQTRTREGKGLDFGEDEHRMRKELPHLGKKEKMNDKLYMLPIFSHFD